MPGRADALTYCLLQARLPDDPVRLEERAAFAARLGVPATQIRAHDLIGEAERPFDRVLGDVDAVLVGGSGAFSVLDQARWIRRFVELLAAVVAEGRPLFASCFGFQALTVALGGEVAPDPSRVELGTHTVDPTAAAALDSVFGALDGRVPVHQGHKDSAIRLPARATLLAGSQRCPLQAFRIEGALIYATQFHAELTAADNRGRFLRYRALYRDAFDDAQARAILDSLVETPEANALLARFAVAVAASGRSAR